MMVLGIIYGYSRLNDWEAKTVLMEKVAEFQRRFTERCGSTICRQLVGYDFS